MADEAGNETMAERVARVKAGETSAAATGAGAGAPTKTLDSDQAAASLGEKTAQVTSGAKKGETVRETPAGRLAESNDVILGDQSTRADGPKPTKPEDQYVSDGSRSPHDATSEGGSRQRAGHSQAVAAKYKVRGDTSIDPKLVPCLDPK